MSQHGDIYIVLTSQPDVGPVLTVCNSRERAEAQLHAIAEEYSIEEDKLYIEEWFINEPIFV